MPTFTAIAFDRLLETRSPTSVDKTVSSPMPGPNSRPPQPKPVRTSKLERRNSASSAERKIPRPQMTPSLYATPKATPLPDSPSSYSPSPYVINHKRRGPRLVKSSTESDVSSLEKTTDEAKCNGIGKDGEHTIPTIDMVVRDTDDSLVEDKNVNGVNGASVGSCTVESKSISLLGGGNSTSLEGYVGKAESPKADQLISERLGEKKDFYDPQESLSYTSNTEREDNGITDHLSNFTSSSMGEFFDAWEELSSESDHQSSSFRDIEKELREIRPSLLMEIEKRKQAEEALTSLQDQWQRLRQELAAIGLTLPAHPNSESELLVVNPVDDICQQVVLARFVSEAIGRGTAKAEMEAKMEEQIEAKNFEITRLMDRLHYYEAMNQEMSQINQEAVERTRRQRRVTKRRQKWIWGSVAAAITLGSAALLIRKGSSSSSSSAADCQELKHLSGTKE